MATVIKTTFQFKRGTAARWAELNLILAAGEPGFELDTGRLKVGNGKTAWNDLPYLAGADGTEITLTPVDGSLIIKDNTIDIGISAEPGNALTKKADGLYVNENPSVDYKPGLGLQVVDGTFSVKLAEETHGLIAIDGALALGLATKEADGAMSKEDKAFLEALKELDIPNKYATKEEVQSLKDTIAEIEQSYSWGEM